MIATPATVRSHAYFNAIKDENPAVEVYEHATPRFVPMVEAGMLAGPEVEAVVEEGLAPLLGERDGAGEFVFPLPPSAKIDTLLLGCTHYPLLRPDADRGGRGAGRDRGLGDRDRVRAGGAAGDQRPRGAGHDPRHGRGPGRGGPLAARRDATATAPPTSSSRPATSSVPRRSPRGCSARRSRTSSRSSSRGAA